MPRPTRVCLASDSFTPANGGGSLQYFRYLPGLAERDVRVSILSGTPRAAKTTPADRGSPWFGLSPGSIVPGAPLNGAPRTHVRLPDRNEGARASGFFRGLVEHCRRPGNRPEVVNVITPHLLTPLSVGALRSVRRALAEGGTSLVYSLTIAPKLPANALRRLVKQRHLARGYRLVDCIIVQSVAHECWLRGLGVETRIEGIPNGVDASRFRPARLRDEALALRAKLGFAPDQPVVVTVGAVCPRKGTDRIVRAFARLADRFPRAQLVVLGWRTDLVDSRLHEFRSDLSGFLRDHPALATRIHFRGAVDNVEEYLRIAEAYVIASDREGFPNSLLEAMASAVPCVVTPFLGLGEDFAEAGRDYLAATRDPDSLAAALASLLGDARLRERVGAGGLRWIGETMDLGAVLDRLASLYVELARRPAGLGEAAA